MLRYIVIPDKPLARFKTPFGRLVGNFATYIKFRG